MFLKNNLKMRMLPAPVDLDDLLKLSHNRVDKFVHSACQIQVYYDLQYSNFHQKKFYSLLQPYIFIYQAATQITVWGVTAHTSC